MSRVKKKLSVLSLLFSLEFLSLGFFTNGTFPWSTHYVPPLVKAASHTHARAVKLDSPAKTDGRFALERYSEHTPRSGVFLTTKENAGALVSDLRELRSLHPWSGRPRLVGDLYDNFA